MLNLASGAYFRNILSVEEDRCTPEEIGISEPLRQIILRGFSLSSQMSYLDDLDAAAYASHRSTALPYGLPVSSLRVGSTTQN